MNQWPSKRNSGGIGGLGGQQWGWGEMISRDILSVNPQEWQVDCGILVREREISYSANPLDKDSRTGSVW